jgi:hypothetical protein
LQAIFVEVNDLLNQGRQQQPPLAAGGVEPMKTSRSSITALVIGSLLCLCACQEKQSETKPQTTSSSTSADLAERTLRRRAVEAVIWGMPAVNFDRMYQAMVHDAKAGEGSNKIVYWSRLFDWKNQTLTPNPDSIYFMPFFNTKDVGPIVLEIPPAGSDGSITGSIDDCWQAALEDVGPAGADKGKGGKYLILPPDYKGKPPCCKSCGKKVCGDGSTNWRNVCT